MSSRPKPPNTTGVSFKDFFKRRETRLAGAVVLVMLIIGAVLGIVLQQDPAEPDNTTADTSPERLVYLAPADAATRNLYVQELGDDRPRQLTDFSNGINEVFAISPAQTHIAFAVSSSEDQNLLDIWVVEIASGDVVQLTNCVAANASCYDPAWHPSGDFVGYTREELDPNLDYNNRKRAWLVDIETLQPSLLFDDELVIGHSPRWGGDGERVALVSQNPTGITVYEYASEETTHIQTSQDVIGVFSPDGDVFVYPQLVSVGNAYYSQIELLNFATDVTIPVSGGFQTPVEDIQVAFSPDGQYLAVVRRYLDNRYTNGGQLYRIDLETGAVDALVVDGNYSHGSISWNGDGTKLLFQRFNFDTATVDVWMYDLTSQELIQVAENALLPKFIQTR